MFLINVFLVLAQMHYMPYSASLQQDAWILSKCLAILAVMPGICGGAILAIAVNNTGIPGEPQFWTLVEHCGCLAGGILSVCTKLFKLSFAGKDKGNTASALTGARFTMVHSEVNSAALLIIWLEVIDGYLLWSGLREGGPALYLKLGLTLLMFFVLGFFTIAYYRAALEHARP
jgi:hypothetical protein